MATAAHCAYCFECLSASLEKRKPLSFREVEELWEQHEAEDDDSFASAQLRAENGEQAADKDMDDAPGPPPAALSRLLNTPSTASSSSSPSAASSTPSLNNDSVTSKSSSRSSLFSLPKRLSLGKKAKTTSSEMEEYPLFVTWDTRSNRGNKSLRGCIGTFEPQELDDGLRSYALTSAFEDHRFNPISVRELPSLECGVTLLTNFETISDPMDWAIGTHGLRISFIHNNRRFGSTYLPDVAREQGWTKEETMVSLMKKGGWSGRSSEWRNVKELDIVRYQGFRAQLGYKEWSEWREWVEETAKETNGKT